MRIASIPCPVMALLALTTLTAQIRDSRTTSEPGITRRLVIDQRSVQVVRSTYQSGAVEPRGPHSFDVVIVPLSQGDMKVKIAGKSVEWKIGEPIFIPRGIEHDIANVGKTPLDFVSIRIP
jgi:mannose-6-phosphate isomerase-like protein (cupin superfamily)